MQTFQALSIIPQSEQNAINDEPYGAVSPVITRPEPVPDAFIKNEAARMIELWTRHQHSSEQRSGIRVPIEELFLPMDSGDQ
ncbi:MAG TPA: hypothetical protein VGU61_15520 [Noviherbaspirillum sp.]|jgi:hypothetical protein|uniref:hypothetical protein n=1 Tax=Noviherbaspirillum sp. TaxID=1926288 RepID=UPI002DDCC5BD|nr:hypothetical protein [Noviherbaspirillum sp.]HEV2611677.1 hypothetical protein [Noviherbaspirillum sp.]